MLGIGVYRSEKNNLGFKLITIVNCVIDEYIGRQYLTKEVVPLHKPYLISFEPQDQFCKVVDLDKIKEDLCPKKNTK